jgi:hypothetical protein
MRACPAKAVRARARSARQSARDGARIPAGHGGDLSDERLLSERRRYNCGSIRMGIPNMPDAARHASPAGPARERVHASAQFRVSA